MSLVILYLQPFLAPPILLWPFLKGIHLPY
jgi:hypothetical protein